MNYKVLLFALLQVLLVSGCSLTEDNTKEVALECKKKTGESVLFIINPAKKISKFVLPDEVVLGSLDTTNEHYKLIFPKTDNRYETHVIIERYTGAMMWEHGKPPFGKNSVENIQRTGKCEQKKAEPKL